MNVTFTRSFSSITLENKNSQVKMPNFLLLQFFCYDKSGLKRGGKLMTLFPAPLLGSPSALFILVLSVKPANGGAAWYVLSFVVMRLNPHFNVRSDRAQEKVLTEFGCNGIVGP